MKRLPLLFLLVASVGACSSRSNVSQAPALFAPSLTVERFLQAANTRDLETMGRLFGTDDGPVADRWRREDVELRMSVLAEILQHRNYEIVSEGMVPGARIPSTRIGVDILTSRGLTVRDVGFTVVVGSGNQWLVNLIDVEKITNGA